jgi:hypothetical protein
VEHEGIAPPPPGVIPPLGAMAEEQELEADVCPLETGKGTDHSDMSPNRNSTVTPPLEVMCKP